ncbi:MAG: ribonuclease G [Hyphomonadaceae bacterium]|nr:MAG: ribonuclease G [Hyphomonadaceae bacterium]KAF0183809.1 MAG: ribonuclease G [Hyphomonadaceae bacterium]
MKSETIKVSRIGENIYALIEDGEIVEIRIEDFTQKQNAKTGQIYVGRVKEVETRLSAAFVDIGGEIGFLSFSAKRPDYLVTGKLIKVKVVHSAHGNKSATLKYIGEVSKNQAQIQLLEEGPEWGEWPTPRIASSQEKIDILEVMGQLAGRSAEIEKGGNITIEPTTALTAIDIDASARIAGGTNQGNFNHKLNLEAAKEIMRQIRLRNLSGLIVVDFVGAPSKIEAAELMTVLKASKTDTRKCEILPISKFGLCEMARQSSGLPHHKVLGLEGCNYWRRTAIEALNALAEEMRIAKGDIVVLDICASAFDELEHWDFNWREFLHENIGVRYDIRPNYAFDYRVSRKNALSDLRH